MDELLMLSRFVQFTAALLLFGGSVFSGLLAPAGLQAELASVQRRLIPALAVLIGISALAWLALEAAEAGDGWGDALNPDTLSAVLVDTAFGQVWIGRLVLAALLLAALALRGERQRWGLLVLSALLLASLGLVGHAAMQEGLVGGLHRLNDATHLLAAGFWLGSLPPLLPTLRLLRHPDRRAEATIALRRFSGLGHFAVAIVLATGIANVYLILGKPPLDVASPYQLLLALKIGLVLAMVLIALANRYLIVPRLAGDGEGPVRAIAAGTLAECGLGALVVGLVSVFGASDPV